MQRKEIPAIIMLSAGLIDCVVSIYNHYSLLQFTEQLLIVLILFYLLGLFVKLMIDIYFPVQTDEQTEEDSAEEDGDLEHSPDDEINRESDEELENIDAKQDEE